MGSRTASGVWVLLLATLAVGCKEPSTKESQPPPRSAAETLSELEKERVAGRPDAALKLARDLLNTDAGTPEAKQAAKQIPELEAALKKAEEAERVRASKAAAAAEAQTLADKWTYPVHEDPMTSRKAKYAIIESENTVTFNFPYQGSQRGTLTLRDHPTYGQDVLFSIERGQLLCRSYSDCQIRVRFDEGKPELWNALGPGDNSSTSIFLRNEPRFIQKLRAAKIVRLQVPVYQEGEPIFEFRVGGLDYARYKSAPVNPTPPRATSSPRINSKESGSKPSAVEDAVDNRTSRQLEPTTAPEAGFLPYQSKIVAIIKENWAWPGE